MGKLVDARAPADCAPPARSRVRLGRAGRARPPRKWTLVAGEVRPAPAGGRGRAEPARRRPRPRPTARSCSSSRAPPRSGRATRSPTARPRCSSARTSSSPCGTAARARICELRAAARGGARAARRRARLRAPRGARLHRRRLRAAARQARGDGRRDGGARGRPLSRPGAHPPHLPPAPRAAPVRGHRRADGGSRRQAGAKSSSRRSTRARGPTSATCSTTPAARSPRARWLNDTLGSILEVAGLLEQSRQGAITRQLAAWAAILAVPTAIAGHLRDELRLHARAARGATAISSCSA